MQQLPGPYADARSRRRPVPPWLPSVKRAQHHWWRHRGGPRSSCSRRRSLLCNQCRRGWQCEMPECACQSQAAPTSTTASRHATHNTLGCWDLAHTDTLPRLQNPASSSSASAAAGGGGGGGGPVEDMRAAINNGGRGKRKGQGGTTEPTHCSSLASDLSIAVCTGCLHSVDWALPCSTCCARPWRGPLPLLQAP